MRRRIAAAVAGFIIFSSLTGYLVTHRTITPTRIATPTHFYETNATQKFRFQASRATRDWDKPRGLDHVIIQVRKAMIDRTGKGFQLDPFDHRSWGPRRTLTQTLHRLHSALKQAHAGAVWRIRPFRNHSFVWRARKIDIDPAKITNTQGTHAIDIIVGSTLHRFPNLNLLGIYECRYIYGTATLSQHAYGNAVDWSARVALMNKVAHWQFKMTNKGWLPISQLLYRGHDWFTGSYVYDHYDHIHDSGKPLLSGGWCNRPGTSSRSTQGTTSVASAAFESGEDGG